MDNASKAIIMAGALLVSIAIVGVGVYLYSSTSSISFMGGQQIDAVAAQTANSVLRNYSGTKVKGSVVNEFKGYIDTLNANYVYPTDVKIASSKFDNSVSGKIVKATDTINSNAYYTIVLNDGNGDGYYDIAQITQNIGVLGNVSGDLEDLTGSGDEENSGDLVISGDDEVSGDVTSDITSGDSSESVETSGEINESVLDSEKSGE